MSPKKPAMITFRTEIQEAIDAITVPLPGESLLDRAERIVVETIDVGGKLVKTFDETNREADLQDLKTELGAAGLVIAGKIAAQRPFLARGAKMFLPLAIDAGVDYLAQESGTIVDAAQRYVAPVFARLRRIGERGEAAFSA